MTVQSYHARRANQSQTAAYEWQAISLKLLERSFKYRRALRWKPAKPAFKSRESKHLVEQMERLDELRLPWYEPVVLFDYLYMDGGDVGATYLKLFQAMASIQPRKGLQPTTLRSRSRHFLAAWQDRLEGCGGHGCHIENLLEKLKQQDGKPSEAKSIFELLRSRYGSTGSN